MQLSLKTANNELAQLGYSALLAKGSGYFYFSSGEAADWLTALCGRTIREPYLETVGRGVSPLEGTERADHVDGEGHHQIGTTDEPNTALNEMAGLLERFYSPAVATAVITGVMTI
jgi:hypothetical protein